MVPGIPGAVWRRRAESEVPSRLAGAVDAGPGTDLLDERLLFALPGIARYLVAQGRAIDFAPADGADPDAVQLFLNGSARGFLIQQRGELALEAAALRSPDGRCLAIAGHSGEGKSTIAATLCRRGWSLVADDITRVTWTGTRAVAWPSDRSVQLWRNACEALGADPENLKQVRTGLQKYFLPLQPHEEPCVLTGIVQLRAIAGFALSPCPPPGRGILLGNAAFRQHIATEFPAREKYRETLAAIASACAAYTLEGARHASVEQLADAIEGVGE